MLSTQSENGSLNTILVLAKSGSGMKTAGAL
jgi:hypothetical protein